MTTKEAVETLLHIGVITASTVEPLIDACVATAKAEATVDERRRCAALADCWGTSSTENNTAAHRRCRNLAKAIRDTGDLEIER